jgi:adenine-specific DNA methylase
MTTRLIETWLPIAELGEESVRERRSMTALPPVYYLHVWWARRPLVASRAAVLASLLPADADRQKFRHVLGIHGDPVGTRKRIDRARRAGKRFEGDAYGYKRAFLYQPTESEHDWIRRLTTIDGSSPSVLDPTSGGGSVPFEAVRLGFDVVSNDLNPVAVLVQRATVEFPLRFRSALEPAFRSLADRFIAIREERLSKFFPREPLPDCIPTNYLWARTITCPYCDGLIPLSPTWRLAPDDTGVSVRPDVTRRVCEFAIVSSVKEHSEGTVSGGDARCPYPDCGRIVDSDDVKAQAHAGRMGDQLYAIVFKRRIEDRTKAGKKKIKWERGYRSPRPADDNHEVIAAYLSEKLPEWEA